MHRVKRIRSDNGGEYVSTSSSEWMQARGIIHELTTAYTPQQNPISERANRTHIETTRAMLFEAKVQDKYWPYAARMSAQLHN